MTIFPKKLLCFTFFGLQLLGLTAAQDSNNGTSCEDPVGAMLTLFDCWATGNATCVVSLTDNTSFCMKHNGQWRFNGTAQNRSLPWIQFYMAAVDYEFDINHVGLVVGDKGENGEDIVSLHYVETGTFTNGESLGRLPTILLDFLIPSGSMDSFPSIVTVK